MYKSVIFFAVFAVACVCAAPKSEPGLAYAAAPVVAAAPVAPAVVTAQSSQVIARNYNALAAPLVAAAPAAPLVAAAPALAVAPALRAAPFVAAPYSPYIAAPAYAAPYVL